MVWFVWGGKSSLRAGGVVVGAGDGSSARGCWFRWSGKRPGTSTGWLPGAGRSRRPRQPRVARAGSPTR